MQISLGDLGIVFMYPEDAFSHNVNNYPMKILAEFAVQMFVRTRLYTKA